VKSLVLVVVGLAGYFLTTVLACHFGKPLRQARVFHLHMRVWMLLVAALYLLSPRDLGFLPASSSNDLRVVGLFYTLGLLVLGGYFYMAVFFGLNGGFSTSILHGLSHRGERGLTTDEVLGLFRGEGEMDKIYAWRLPRLVETGYVDCDRATGLYRLTAKGRFAARVGLVMKWTLNLGKGG
jgi:hypothetical protein